MPPKAKGKSAAKKKGAKEAPVKLEDKDLLKRAEIEIACLQGLLEVKSQEVNISPRSQTTCSVSGVDAYSMRLAGSDSSSARAALAPASGCVAAQFGTPASGSARHNLQYAEAVQGVLALKNIPCLHVLHCCLTEYSLLHACLVCSKCLLALAGA